MSRGARCASASIGLLLLSALACGRSDGVASERLVRAFDPQWDVPIQTDAASVEGEVWRVAPKLGGSVRLFELAKPGIEGSVMLIYRAQLRAVDLVAPAYLEMWVRLPGRGSFFSKGLANPLRGTSEWASYEIPFRLEAAQIPDLVSLNLTFEAPGGEVHMRDVAVLAAPLER